MSNSESLSIMNAGFTPCDFPATPYEFCDKCSKNNVFMYYKDAQAWCKKCILKEARSWEDDFVRESIEANKEPVIKVDSIDQFFDGIAKDISVENEPIKKGK